MLHFCASWYLFIDISLSEIDQSEGEETEGSEMVSTVTELMQYNTEEDYMVKEEEENLDGNITFPF